MNFLELSEALRKWLSYWIAEDWVAFVTFITGFGVLAVLCFTIWFFTREVIIRVIRRIVTRTETRWDDKLFEYKVFRQLSMIVIAIVITHAVPVLFRYYPDWLVFSLPLAQVFVVVTILRALSAVLNAIGDLLETTPSLSDKPIRSYKQVAKIIFLLIGLVFILSILLGQSPLYILTGFGAVTAILLLIFRDAILGFTASIQMSAIDLVRIGDWITVEKFGADGEVIEINLTTVKVRNWDMTVTLVPSYALVSESFRNWRGMQESDGRRIKRFMYIKISSIRYCDEDLYNRLLKVERIRDYLLERHREIETFNSSGGIDKSVLINGRHMTNIGIFRQYAEVYIRQNPFINAEMTYMVRQLQPTQHGLPIEVYAFSREKALERFEGVAADIFDHLFAAISYFDLEVFESPSGGERKVAEEDSGPVFDE